MGVDINVYLEVKEQDGWRMIPLLKNSLGEDVFLYDGRNYGFFDLLGYNGTYFKGIASYVFPRGLPDDIAEETKMQLEDIGTYRETWFDYCELMLLSRLYFAEYGHGSVEGGAYGRDSEFNDPDDEEGSSYDLNKLLTVLDFFLVANDILIPNPGEIRVIIGFDS